MSARVQVILGLLAVLAIGVLYFGRPESTPGGRTTPDAVFLKASPATASPGSAPLVERITDPSEVQRILEERFGQGLKPEFTKEGILSAVRGAREGSRPTANFRPEDPQAAIERAREVLRALEGALGLQAHSPLEDPAARNNANSAQVYFQQKIEGRPLAPYGSVTVDLGPNGELLGLDSAYVRDVRTAGTHQLTVEQARVRARSAAAGQVGAGSRVDGGHSLYWLASPGGQSRLARPAYEFDAGGVQVIVDAEDGRILSKRDQRQR